VRWLLVIWLCLSSLLTSLTLVGLSRLSGLSRLASFLTDGNRFELGLGLLLFAFANILKTARLRLVTATNTDRAPLELFGIVCLYNLLSSILPAGLGEASYPALLKLRRGVALSISLPAILISRLFDLFVIAAFSAGAIWATTSLVQTGWLMLGVALMPLAGVGIIFAISASARNWLRPEEHIAGLWHNFITWVEQARTAIARLTLLKRWVITFAITAEIWLVNYAVNWLVAQSLHMRLSVAETVLGASLALLLSALPFKGLLGLGTQQAGWILGLVWAGRSPEFALNLGVLLHLIILSYTLLLGLFGWGLVIIHPARQTG
jgi:uncharacterized membrane protein YbhN (UPF0104 family)